MTVSTRAMMPANPLLIGTAGWNLDASPLLTISRPHTTAYERLQNPISLRSHQVKDLLDLVESESMGR
jgi:hypothetical protein